MRGRRGFDRFALTWSPVGPAFGAEVRVEIGYLTALRREAWFSGETGCPCQARLLTHPV